MEVTRLTNIDFPKMWRPYDASKRNTRTRILRILIGFEGLLRNRATNVTSRLLCFHILYLRSVSFSFSFRFLWRQRQFLRLTFVWTEIIYFFWCQVKMSTVQTVVERFRFHLLKIIFEQISFHQWNPFSWQYWCSRKNERCCCIWGTHDGARILRPK